MNTKKCSKCGIVKPHEDFHRAKDKPRSDCKDCIRLRKGSKKRITRTPEEKAEHNRQKVRAWKAANPEKERERQRRYLEQNRAKVSAKWTKRRRGQKTATPPWVDMSAIAALYAEAERLTAETGVLHHVDHIVPLIHQRVCGLNVPWNMRPIPATDNLRKRNRLIDGDGVEYFPA